MAKLFLLVAILGVVVWFFFRSRGSHDSPVIKESAPLAENIVVCAHCQLRIPESESIRFAGRHYCCEEHRKLGAS